MAELDARYNGVSVEKSWSLVDFAKAHGKIKFAKDCVNKETGEVFDCLACEAPDKSLTFIHFGYSLQGATAQTIMANKDNIQVGLNTNGKYTCYLQKSGWETLDLL